MAEFNKKQRFWSTLVSGILAVGMLGMVIWRASGCTGPDPVKPESELIVEEVIIPVLPGRDEAWARHLEALVKSVPAGFVVIEQHPFFVVGDDTRKKMEQYAGNTVKWAVNLLKKDFFAKDPEDIIDIWLFKDNRSYRHYAREIFGDSPDTPFGYYSAEHKALIMNIATGGGTLVHEIVHPFMRANFPACPAWLNEGMGSLYEQCGEQDGHIIGYTNWRLAGLQKALREGRVPAFSSLLAMNEHAFYSMDKGTNYSQARYLCYYLQEKGLLRAFYRDFTANAAQDPSGLKTLIKTLDIEDMKAFRAEWEAFVMGLKFP